MEQVLHANGASIAWEEAEAEEEEGLFIQS
jgi:hypothetical protein